MGRAAVQLKRIENPVNRQVTFGKRRRGLFKKAQELAVLCDANVGLLVIPSSGRLFNYFSSGNMRALFESCLRSSSPSSPDADHHFLSGPTAAVQYSKAQEVMMLRRKVEHIQKQRRHFKGDDLTSLTIEELGQLEKKICKGLRNIDVFKELPWSNYKSLEERVKQWKRRTRK